MSHDDFAAEPDPATPGHLPKGETILWQGGPDGFNLAWRVYHLREVTAYFALLLSWRAFSSWWESGLISKVVANTSPLLLPYAIAAVLLIGVGILCAKTTHYTITDRRIVMRTGMAMPGTLNLPFTSISAANHRDYGTANQIGDLGVEISEGKLAYLMLWPHVKPWALRNPQPMMRCVPDSAAVAKILVQALRGEGLAASELALSRNTATSTTVVPNSGMIDGQLAI